MRKCSDRKEYKERNLEYSKTLKHKSKDRGSNFLVVFSWKKKAQRAIERGEGMAHWCWPQFLMTHETCPTCSTKLQIRKVGLFSHPRWWPYKIKRPAHVAEGGHDLRKAPNTPIPTPTPPRYTGKMASLYFEPTPWRRQSWHWKYR